ncbi:hypothetical protein [Rhodoplanes sp. SY1]|uniref:hypothetical protein n=1 Tax=Rhodoplanes sp. SY1 TaxID=3166646 RepID=UPI0038B50108
MTATAQTTNRTAELFAIFDAMSFDNILDAYEIAVANGDADLVAALDRYNGQPPAEAPAIAA